MKIVVLDGYGLNPGDLSWEPLHQLGQVMVYDRTAAKDVVERIGDAEIIYTNKTVIDRVIMKQCPNLQWIGVLATGYNVVDIQSAKELGIMVANVPAYSTQSVAQFVFALLLELCHHVGEHSQSVHRGGWINSQDFCYWNYPLMELDQKVMGIVGFGRIGQRTAQMAQAFGMEVIAYSPSRIPGDEESGVQFVSLDDVLASADVISLHCPLNESTQGIIDQDAITKMKDGMLLINTSRGPLIVDQDLRDALESGKIAGAACDVMTHEPMTADNVLLNAPNLIITPHIAWAPIEARQRLMDTAVANLNAFVQGHPINIVNK